MKKKYINYPVLLRAGSECVFMRKMFIKICAVLLALLITFGDSPVVAGGAFSLKRPEEQKLSPASRFWMPAIREDGSGDYILTEDTSEEPLVDLGESTPTFKNDVVFLYLSRLIAQVMTRHKAQISAEGLVKLVDKHLSHLEPFHDPVFKWRDMYKDGNTFCLPYVREGGTSEDMLLMRYYLPEDDEAGLFGEIFIPVGLGDVRVTCEWGEGIIDSDALMVHAHLLKGNYPLSRVIYGSATSSAVFFNAMLEALFLRLQHDFEGTTEFIDLCRRIIDKEGISALRTKMEKRDKILERSFRKIRSSRKTRDISISLYGILLYFLTTTPENDHFLQETVDDLYDELVKEGYFSQDPSFLSGAERGIYRSGEEVFEARGRRFSFGDISRWKVEKDTVEAIAEHIPEIAREIGRAEILFSAEENALMVDGEKYDLVRLRELGVPESILLEMEERRALLENILEDFRSRRRAHRVSCSWALAHLYDEFMKTRSSRDVSLAKQGASYHIPGHSIVHLYPKSLIYEGPSAVFMSSLMRTYGESVPMDKKWTLNAQKITRALEVWQKYSPETEDVMTEFVEKGSVVELDMDTSLLFSDPDKNVVRPLQVGRGRNVFYISKEYLDELEIDNEEHMKELAFLLKLGQSFLDSHQGFSEEKEDLSEVQEAVEDFNLHFLEWSQNSSLMDMDSFKDRMLAEMSDDFIIKYTNAIEEILKEEDDLAALEERASENRDFTSTRADLHSKFWLNYSLLSRYSGMGMSEMADRTYRRLKEATKAMQRYDKAGLMPYDFQVKLVFTSLKFGYWEDFMEETETLLTGRNFSNDLSESEKVFIRSMIAPVRIENRGYSLEEQLMRSLHSQIRVLSPENAIEIESRVRALIEESRMMQEMAGRELSGDISDFESIALRSTVIDLEGSYNIDKVLRIISEEGARLTGLDSRDILDRFHKREAQGSTITDSGLAIPHIVLPGDEEYSMVVVRSRDGIIFPGGQEPVKALFALMGPRENDEQVAFHLRMLMGIAHATKFPGFMERWLACRNEEALRLLLVSSGHEEVSISAGQETTTETEQDEGKETFAPQETSFPPGVTEVEQAAELDISRESAMAVKFLDALMLHIEMKASAATASEKKIVIGIDTTEWVPDDPEHQAAIQGLLNRLSHLSRKRGLGELVVKRRKGAKDLARVLRKVKAETGAPVSDFVILGNADSMRSGVFADFMGTEGEAGAFLAGVELPEDFAPDSYVRIIEMLTMAINMAFGVKVDQSEHPGVNFRKINSRFYIFVPEAVRFDPAVYLLQRREIDTRA